ncbi:MAG TPA: S8 family serine peptidase, partial [Bacteroidales bacterium]|nr:S8 family serine peptidase [Bacteroidales bacterium]
MGVAGIAPDCEIMPISYNFYNYDNPEIRLAKGINYAWQNGADILSCSWRSGQHLYIDNAINNAITNGRNGLGTVVVVASGNYNNSTVDYPSVLPGVISVGAINMCGTRCVGWHTEYNPEDSLMQDCFNYWWPMEFGSNYGDHLSVVAPGIKVPTTNIVDNNWNTDKYITVFRGTSAAAPHVSGVAALLLSMRTDLTYTEVKDAIESTAQKIRTDFYDYNVSKPNGMWNEKLGYGLVDAYNAIMELCTNQTSIGSGQNITWDETTFVCDDLEIEGTLTIDAGVYFLTEEPVITVKSGGHLKIDDGNFYLYDGLDYNGEIVVNAGGSIELLSASELTIGGTGSILIENSSATNGTLTYNNEATLTLADDDTYLEIEGELEIGDNSTFTFSGDGYIKFSKPGNDLETQD